MSTVKQIMSQLCEEFPDTFFLSGSRKMAELTVTHTDPILVQDNTDWDYNATFSLTLEDYLLSKGFYLSPAAQRALVGVQETNPVFTIDDIIIPSKPIHAYLLDTQTIAIYELTCVDGIIQVNLRKDASIVRMVFECMDPNIYRKYLWKSSGEPTMDRSMIGDWFNLMFKLVYTARNSPNPNHVNIS